MNDEAAFIRAICAEPGEDTPRLVFADWLQEQGSEVGAARAAYIRAQVESHRLAPPLPLRYTHPALVALRARLTPAPGTFIPGSDPIPPPETFIPGSDPIPPPETERFAGRSMFRRRVARLENEQDALLTTFGAFALLGVTPAELPAGFSFSEDDLRHGSRRGFLGALVCPADIWEAFAATLCGLFPVEEVHFAVGAIPNRSMEYYPQTWPTIRFNPR